MNDLATIDQTALAQLREKAALAATIQVWRPIPGEVLEGVIAGSRKVQGPFGEQAQVLIRTPTGALVAAWLTEWLLGQLQAQAADLGDLVSLQFVCKETGSKGQQFNRMVVTVLKA